MEFLKFLPAIPRKKPKQRRGSFKPAENPPKSGYPVPCFGGAAKIDESERVARSHHRHESDARARRHHPRASAAYFAAPGDSDSAISVSADEAAAVRRSLEAKYAPRGGAAFVGALETLIGASTDASSLRLRSARTALSDARAGASAASARSAALSSALTRAESAVDRAQNELLQSRLSLRRCSAPKPSVTVLATALLVRAAQLFVLLFRVLRSFFGLIAGSAPKTQS